MPKTKTTKVKSEPKAGSDLMDLVDSDQEIVVDTVPSSNFLQTHTLQNSDRSDECVKDEIVREIPVYFSPQLAQQIQLIQYPLQQKGHTKAPEAVRLKPKHCMMEMDHKTPSNIQFDGMYHMPSRTFSSQTIPVKTHMALGKLLDGGLHLVPISRMTQMRPSFAHIDEAMAATAATTETDSKEKNTGVVDPLTGRKAIGFQKKESERQELARKSSYGYKKASEDSEGWHSLDVYDEDSLQAEVLLQKVACPDPNNNLLNVESLEKESKSTTSIRKIPGTSLTATYLNTMNYLPPREEFGGDTMHSGAAGKGKTSGENMDEDDSEQAQLSRIVSKLVRLMRLGRPIPFSLLRNEFPLETATDEALFVALGNCAVLVRGNWCLNSKLLSYPPAMTRARTFLMCLFQSMRVVHRERLLKVFEKDENEQKNDNDGDDDDPVTPEVIAFLLEQLGEKIDEGWVLKVADNVKFMEDHPQTTMVHLQYWAKQIDLFRPMFEKYRGDDSGMDES